MTEMLDNPSSPAGRILTGMTPRELPPALEATRAVQTPLRRVRAAQARLEAAEDDFRATRRQAVTELVDAGLTYAQVGDLLGISRARVHQILRGLR